MYFNINSNYGFDDSLIIPNAEFETNIYALMYTRAISVGGNLGSISLIVPGAKVDAGVGNLPALQGKSSGLGDITLMGVFSLMGAPAYSKEEFSSYTPETIVDLLIAVTAPTGEYDADKLINLGTNRWSVRVGAPIMHFFSAGPGNSTSLEVQPSVTFFTDNDDTSLEQAPLYKLEAHLTHDFTMMFWGSVDAMFTAGGETTVNGLEKDNSQRSLGLGVSLGAFFSPTLGMTLSYGEIVSNNEHSQDGKMFRLTGKYLF
ncbi:transporter [Sulfurovum riftiae]|nr:transporter [Sulfurovum riftiae]